MLPGLISFEPNIDIRLPLKSTILITALSSYSAVIDKLTTPPATGLGYTFKIFTPGQHYNYEESVGNIKLVLSSKISGGIINNHIYIYLDSIKIDVNFLKSNLAFVYRHLINDNEAYITAPTFRNLDDFKNAMTDIISIYEDFKKEFLKLIENNKLTEI